MKNPRNDISNTNKSPRKAFSLTRSKNDNIQFMEQYENLLKSKGSS